MANIVWNYSFDNEVGNNLLFEFAVAFEVGAKSIPSIRRPFPLVVPLFLARNIGLAESGTTINGTVRRTTETDF